MDALLDLVVASFASVYAFYGIAFLLLPAVTFAYLPLLVALAWAVSARARQHHPWPWRHPWPRLPPLVRRLLRLATDLAFGLSTRSSTWRC